MMFWIDNQRKINISYEEFFNGIQNIHRIPSILYFKETYEFIVHLFASIYSNIDVEIIDSDLSEVEMIELGITPNRLLDSNTVEISRERFNSINVANSTWSCILYTSGTTGKPKKIKHNLSSLTRFLKRGVGYQSHVWGLAYNPTHIAGLQVIFQAFYNRNPLIYVFNTNPSSIEQVLRTFGVTHLSATPTFYRTFMPYVKEPVTSVKRITMGGESFDNLLVKHLEKLFPNGVIRNIYASTEAGSLLQSNGETFLIPEQFKEKIIVKEQGELLVHRSLLGEFHGHTLDDNWYHTGDLVELVSPDELKFIGRVSDFISVGGYKVNPKEVEDVIIRIPEIVDARVVGRNNRITGSILVAQIVVYEELEDEDTFIKEVQRHLSDTLQPWKVPRIITLVSTLDQTRTGKKVRT